MPSRKYSKRSKKKKRNKSRRKYKGGAKFSQSLLVSSLKNIIEKKIVQYSNTTEEQEDNINNLTKLLNTNKENICFSTNIKDCNLIFTINKGVRNSENNGMYYNYYLSVKNNNSSILPANVRIKIIVVNSFLDIKVIET